MTGVATMPSSPRIALLVKDESSIITSIRPPTQQVHSSEAYFLQSCSADFKSRMLKLCSSTDERFVGKKPKTTGAKFAQSQPQKDSCTVSFNACEYRVLCWLARRTLDLSFDRCTPLP